MKHTSLCGLKKSTHTQAAVRLTVQDIAQSVARAKEAANDENDGRAAICSCADGFVGVVEGCEAAKAAMRAGHQGEGCVQLDGDVLRVEATYAHESQRTGHHMNGLLEEPEYTSRKARAEDVEIVQVSCAPNQRDIV